VGVCKLCRTGHKICKVCGDISYSCYLYVMLINVSYFPLLICKCVVRSVCLCWFMLVARPLFLVSFLGCLGYFRKWNTRGDAMFCIFCSELSCGNDCAEQKKGPLIRMRRLLKLRQTFSNRYNIF
jgi:hypothetical protein